MKHFSKFFGLLAVGFALCGQFMVAAQAQTPLKKTLPNGLTVLVQENHGAPVVGVRIYVKTGSIYEDKLLGSGLSHLFEHTLFEGTKTRSKVQINDEIQAIGGQSNAYTSYDVTCYHLTTAANYFDRAMALLGDMVQNATFPEAEVKVQQGVIHNEMNLGADDPDRLLSELFYKTAFKVHPVRLPIIGFGGQFDRLTREDILNYYKTHYTPENTILSVSGDVSASAVFDGAASVFGKWERQTAYTPVLPTEPNQTSPRRAVVDGNVQLGYVQMGWHTIPLQHADLYALDTLAQILGGGESSRLVQEVREKSNLVTSIGAYSSTPNYDAGMFSVRYTSAPANVEKAQTAILNQVANLRRTLVTDEELQRAKNQIKAAFVFNSQGVESQAEQIAYDELGTGDPSYSQRYVNRILGVTAEQIQMVAQKYLLSDGLTTAIVRPAPKTEVKRNAAATAAVPIAQMVRLPNGVRVILRPNKISQTVSIVVMGAGGARIESVDKTGVANAAARMITRGTKVRTAQQLATVVDTLGGSLDGFSGYNAWGVQSSWLSDNWKQGLYLVAESVLQPTFPQDELDRVKAQTLAGLAQQQEDPSSSAALLLRSTFYGNHPYGRNVLGTPAAIKSLTQADLTNYWSSVLRPQNTIIAVYGDFDREAMVTQIAKVFGTFKADGPVPTIPAPVVVPSSFKQASQEKPGLAQAVIWLGYASIDVHSEDRYALDVLDAALSGSDLPGGRLHARLRDNELVYVVHAYDQPTLDKGMFIIYAATTKANEEKVKQIILEEVGKVRDADITQEELDRAKSMSIAAQAINLQNNLAQARTAATDELYGLGFRDSAAYAAKINSITLADVRRVAKGYLQEEHAAMAVVGPTVEPAKSETASKVETPAKATE